MIITNNLNQIGGMEFATFKLKADMTEIRLIELMNQVENQFLSQQEELILHFLVRGEDDTYANVAIASSEEKAKEYCQQWLQNGVAKQYLELMESESVRMTFWTKIA